MQYTYSEHYRENPIEEIKAAYDAGNTPDSINATLEARMLVENNQIPRDTEAIQRLEQQLTYLGSLAIAQELKVA